MEFWHAIADLARRWRVMLTVVLVSSSLAAAVVLVVPVQYVSSATMVLTTTEHGGSQSQDPNEPDELTNPMLNFSDSLSTTADMLIWSMSSADVRESLSDGGSTEVLVNDGRTNPDLFGFTGPIIYITGKSTDPDLSVAGVERASTMVQLRLLEWQRSMKAPASTYVTMVDVVAPTAAAPQITRQVKLAATAWVAGVLLSMTAAYLTVRVRERRAAGVKPARPTRVPSRVPSPPAAPVEVLH